MMVEETQLPNSVAFISDSLNKEFREKLSKTNEIFIDNKYYTTYLQIYDYSVTESIEVFKTRKFDACILNNNSVPEDFPTFEIQILVNENDFFVEGWEHCKPDDVSRILEALQAHNWPLMESKKAMEYSAPELASWRDQALRMSDVERRNFISEKMFHFQDAYDPK
eukprot:NODE_356_length_10223_cov_0.363098.p6 type:complete len:166 gc:universal NODE_356_length_10223_cov_0.363098:670-173(-)